MRDCREQRAFLDFLKGRSSHEVLVLATLVATEGSSYKKAGAIKMIATDGTSAGLMSGGCLEADIVERALAMKGRKEISEFDSRLESDRLLGYGLGCQGLLRVEFEKKSHGELLAELENWPQSDQLWIDVVGAGPDVDPLKELIETLAWHQKYFSPKSDLVKERETQGFSITQVKPDQFPEEFLTRGPAERTALLLMSHSYETDLLALAVASQKPPKYVGVLGPRERQLRMIEDLKEIHGIDLPEATKKSIYGPMGLPGLGRGESAIALSIVAQLQKVFFKNETKMVKDESV